MQRIVSDNPGPGQDMAREIIEWATELNILAVRWVPGHKGMVGNETVDAYAKQAAMDKAPDRESKKLLNGSASPSSNEELRRRHKAMERPHLRFE